MGSKKTGEKAMPFALKQKPEKNFFLKELPFYYLLPVFFVFFVLLFMRDNQEETAAVSAEPPARVAEKNYKVFNESESSLIQPLLLVEKKTESAGMLHIKRLANFTVNQLVTDNVITKASVYVNKLSANEWFAINPELEFTPASLLKIPYLLIYLRESETNPAILDKKLTLTEKKNYTLSPSFLSKSIEIGKPYTIRDLLTYMIVYSDNNATYLLHKNLNYEAFQKLFTEIDMPPMPDMSARDYKMNVFAYSRFFQILYNATYLNPKNSEFALKLLTQCDFVNGMMTGVPPGITVAHKFGESGFMTQGSYFQLHESGIIYLKDNPIIITIFTEGKDIKVLPEAIGRITKQIIASVSEGEKGS
jgi:beta-lactamase class A